ncbi:MAG: transglutaminase domain-containing protein, partial [Terriglobales bacterium]
MTPPSQPVKRKMPPVLKRIDRSLVKAISPAQSKKTVLARKIDASKIYKGGVATPHGIGGDASNTVDGPPSITELVRALKNDPQLIFEWVYNNIDWEVGWGLLKGAFGTVVEGRGNSFDQSNLLVTMLRAAGYTANYVLGTIQISAPAAAAWFATDPDSIDSALNYAFYNAIPVEYVWNESEDAFDIQMGHVWVQCVIDETTYVFDPSYKTYTRKDPVSDLGTILGYDSATFVSDAVSGATIDPDGLYVQDINESNINSNLSEIAGNLATWIKTNKPDASIDDIVGGASIVPVTLPVLLTSLPYEADGDSPTIWTGDIPLEYKTTFELNWTDADIDQTFTSDQLCGARLTVWWTDSETGSTPTLYLNGTAVQTGSEIPSWYGFTYPNFTVTHNAFADTWANETSFGWLGVGNMALIGTAWAAQNRGGANLHQ